MNYELKIYLKYKAHSLKSWFLTPVETKPHFKRVERESLRYLGYVCLLTFGWAYSDRQYLIMSVSGILCIFSFMQSDYATGKHRAWNRQRLRQQGMVKMQNEEVKDGQTNDSNQA